MIQAKVIADSVSPEGDRLTTIEATMHRFVLAEFNTHRVFSRNSASSRAIPVKKQIARVAMVPAMPVVWAAEQPGMQGGGEIDNPTAAEMEWRMASQAAIQHATRLTLLGVHKSIVNRLLEPFMWHTVIVSSTEWDNFWVQRCSPLAQPEMRACAEAMQQAYNASTPRLIKYGDWHLPYFDRETLDWALDRTFPFNSEDDERLPEGVTAKEACKRISAARCARVSYLTHDGHRDPWEDLKMYDRLVSASPPHASPLEHVACPVDGTRFHLGNFEGWSQLRHQVDFGQGATT